VPQSPDIRLLSFRGDPPHRQIAMVWRRSSAMGDFLMQLAGEFRKLPEQLLRPPQHAPSQGSRL
jgi:LysR family hydrogen peroxide-inducible transcriptional activator